MLPKRSLAVSGLPTPKTTLIETNLTPDQLQRPGAIDAETERMMSGIQARSGDASCREQRGTVSFHGQVGHVESRRSLVASPGCQCSG